MDYAKWDAENETRTAQALARVKALLGEPSYHHPGDGRPAWEDGGWRVLVGDGDIVLIEDQKGTEPSPEVFIALGYCVWLGMGAYIGERRRLSAQHDE